MGVTAKRSSIHIGETADQGAGGPQNPVDFDRDILIARMRAAGAELENAGRAEEVTQAISNTQGGLAGRAGDFLVDAAQSPFAGEAVLQTGTGNMGLNHILNRHYADFKAQELVSCPQDAVDFLMHTIRTGVCLEANPASGGSGTTFTLQSEWRYQNPVSEITINAKGEVITFRPVSREAWPAT